ncbi:MAG: TolC family protein [Chthoniobacteraceae bacterium]
MALATLTVVHSFAAAPAPAKTDSEPITMTEAIHLALQNNLDIQASNLDVVISDATHRQAYGDFDPKFDLLAEYVNTLTPQNAAQYVATSGVAGTQRIYTENDYQFHVSLQGKTMLGTQYALTFQDDQLRNTLNEDPSVSIFSPEYQSFLGLQVRQPLLKDFGPDATLAGLRITQKSKEISQLTWRGKVIDSIAGVMVTYYKMLFAVESVRLRQQAVDGDQKLLDQNRRRLQLGFMSPIDVRQAEVAVSSDQGDLLEAQDYFMQQQFALKQQLFSDMSQDSGRDFDPVTGLHEMPLPGKTRDELLHDAFQNRYDYQAAMKTVERESLRIRYAKNQLYPNVDLIGSYGVNGLRGGYDTSILKALQNRTPSIVGGIEVAFPIGNRQARGLYDQVVAQKTQALVRLKQAEMKVVYDVDAALSHIETTRQRVITAQTSTRAAEEALKIANGELDQGLLSSFDVIDQKKKLDDARIRELQAVVDMNVSLVQLWVSTGTLLDEQNVHIGPALPAAPAKKQKQQKR